MHDIEPYYKWRDEYVAAEDRRSPFFGQTYNEFQYTTKIYNYFIHPQWDHFGSTTLYMKAIFVNYEKGYAFLELIGEWNDTLHNDIMYLKREIIDHMTNHGIYKFILACDNVLNFHASDDSYYEEWWDDIKEYGGWVVLLDTFDHVKREMDSEHINYYVNYGPQFNELDWRRKTPSMAYKMVSNALKQSVKSLSY